MSFNEKPVHHFVQVNNLGRSHFDWRWSSNRLLVSQLVKQ
jgi:hypothetical protein